MQSVRLHAIGDLRVEEIPAPAAPEPDEALIRVTMAGICGSDLHNFRTGAWITRAPSVAGHEFTGIVESVGAGVDHVQPGDRVIVDSCHVCGTCRACLSGRGQVCAKLGFLGEVIDGGFAEATLVPGRNLLRAPEGVPDRHLTMAEPLAVALHALDRLAPPAGAPVLVAGCGPIGGLVALLAAEAGHAVTVLDTNAARTALVAETTGGNVADPGGPLLAGIEHAVDTTGHAAVIGKLADELPGCGRLALVGIGRAVPALDPLALVERELTILGCHAFTDVDLAGIARRLPALSPRLDPFIAAEIPLSEVPTAYKRHLAGEVDGLKTLIICTSEAPETP